MKKVLGMVVAVAFVFATTSVFAADVKTAEAAKSPAPAAKTADTKAAAPAKVEEKVVAKSVADPKADCLKKFPGKTEKDAEVTKCIADANKAPVKSETKSELATKPADTKAPAKVEAKKTK